MIIGPHIIIMMNYDVSLIFVHDILSTFGALPQLPRFQKCIFGLSGNVSYAIYEILNSHRHRANQSTPTRIDLSPPQGFNFHH